MLEIVDLPCYLLRYLTICQKYIYKSVNNFVNREVGIENSRKKREREGEENFRRNSTFAFSFDREWNGS